MSVFSWFGQMFSRLQAAADLNEASSATENEPSGCQIYADALEQKGLELDRLTEDIGALLDQLWACRKSAATAVSELSLNTTQQSVNGAKLLLLTAGNRVRQVRDEIEIVTRQDVTE